MGRQNLRPHRGTMLIVTIVITFALAGMVLVLCRTMRVETLAAANTAAVTQASAIERGAEQYILSMITQEGDGVRDVSEDYFNAVRVGDGMFWVLRPQYDDGRDAGAQPTFGLVEESGKVNLNTENFEQVMRLPGMTYTAASSIMDWIDADSNVERDGAESDYYLALPEPYYCKNARFETVEELLLVRGVDREMLYGDGTAPPLGDTSRSLSSAASGSMNDPQIARGLYDLITVYSAESNTTADGQQRINLSNNNRAMRRALQQRLLSRNLPQQRVNQIVVAIGTSNLADIFELYTRAKLKPDEFDQIYDDVTTGGNNTLRGRININVAPRSVLACLAGLDDSDVDKLVSARQSASGASAPTGLGWVADALGDKAVTAKLGSQITTRTYQYSADILAVTSNGRAFKRCRIVVNTRSGTPQIIYRRDISDRGWPMDKQILASLRSGQYGALSSAGGSLNGNGVSGVATSVAMSSRGGF